MEPPLSIPPPYQVGLAKINGLSDETFQELLVAFRDAPLTISPNALASNVASKVSAVPQRDARQIVTALLALYSLRNQMESSISGTAEYISRAMSENSAGELKLESEERERFKERIIQLLDLNSLDVTGRAGNVLLEHEHVLREARIMTDLRPVFGKDLGEGPIAAVTVHMLKLVYEDRDAEREFFVALDTDDIQVIRELLERADTKAESLKRAWAATKVPYVDPS